MSSLFALAAAISIASGLFLTKSVTQRLPGYHSVGVLFFFNAVVAAPFLLLDPQWVQLSGIAWMRIAIGGSLTALGAGLIFLVVTRSSASASAVKDTDKSKSDTDTKPAMVITKAEDPIPFTPAMNISTTRLSFADTDNAVDTTGTQYKIEAPKTIERLEQISSESHRRMLAEAAQEDDDDGNERLSIGDTIKLNVSDINDIGHHLNFNSLNPPILEGIETLY